jgi:signal-transduction protein with cAMP-binding, CBS, and nucleotidyltransferase domain
MGPAMKHDTGFGVLTGNNIETHFFKAGSTIFREGDAARALFVIKSGRVRIQLGNRTLTELAADDIFGEMALIDSEPRSATALAAPYFALKVMRVLAQRLRVSNKTVG